VVQYLIRRFGLFLLTLLGAVIFIFIILRVVPGDPLTAVLGEEALELSVETREAIRKDLGLDKPLPIQLFNYIKSVLTGNLGTSYRTDYPVIKHIGSTIVPTLMLTGSAILIAIIVGVPIGIFTVFHRFTFVDYFTIIGAVSAISAPKFWVGLLAIYFLSYKLGLFPMYGSGFGDGFWSIIYHLILPALVTGLRMGASTARLTRSYTLEILNFDYIRTARSKGLSERAVFYKHALRNAGVALITIIGISAAYSIGTAVVVEKVFSRRGLGRLLTDAMLSRDYIVVQGVILVFAAWVAIINLIVDLSYGLIDPRIKYD